MLVNKAVQFALLAAAVLLESSTDAARIAAVKICGRLLSETMSKVCHVYNSPAWDLPTVVEQPTATVRRKRDAGIADECCMIGCTIDQLTEYCAVSAYTASPIQDVEEHVIADRSAEQGVVMVRETVPAPVLAVPAVGSKGHGRGQRGGRARGRGYGRARRGRRCWCRRKRRAGRRRASPLGNMALVNSAVYRAAPIVGTVSPLITWGRTLNTDLSTNAFANPNSYAYVVTTK